MIRTTVGKALINAQLPPELRSWQTVYNKKEIQNLFDRVAKEQPDDYPDILQKLSDVGRKVTTSTGGMSFNLDHLRTPQHIKAMRAKLDQQVESILDDESIDDKEKGKRIVLAAGRLQKPLEDAVMKHAIDTDNPLGHQVVSGARGNPTNLRSLIGGDLLYVDHRGHVVPMPVTRSYSEGLTPAQYWAGTYGARKGVYDLKELTADAGFLNKQLIQATHRLVVTDHDSDDSGESSKHPRGLPVDTDDHESIGALLAHPAGGFKRNDVITQPMLDRLRRKGIDKVLARSPLVGGPASGLYSRDVGIREKGVLPPRGDWVGIAGAQAISQVLTQAQICLAEGTLVRMADWSVKPIEAIRRGDWVMGSDCDGNLRPVKVLRHFVNGERDCVRAVFRVSTSNEFIDLVATGEHKVLASVKQYKDNGVVRTTGKLPLATKSIRKSFRATMPQSVENDGGVASPYALLLGLLLGDGCYTNSVSGVHLSCFDPLMISDIADYLNSLGLHAAKLKGHKGYYRISQNADKSNQDPQTGRMLPGTRNPIKAKLQVLGMYGKYAHEKQLPPDVWQWSRSSIAVMLGGLFATDGSIFLSESRQQSKSFQVSFGSTSLALAEGVRQLLRVCFAIWPSPISPNTTNRKRTLYSFTITRPKAVLSFCQQIPLVGKKRKLAAKIVKLNARQPQYENGLYRQSIEAVGMLPTYDIEVNNADHLFVLANGLIVSNSSKHTGGVAGNDSGVQGFPLINQLVQFPEVFRGGATHATKDGRVEAIQDAPQGGQYITVGGVQHHVSKGLKPIVKVNDDIEAGDELSEGIGNPQTLAEHKGLGEGARRFVGIFKKAMNDSGMKAHRRNVELIARGLFDHVQLTDEYGDHLPDDIVSYRQLESDWKPRPGTKSLPPKRAMGNYLEQPVLHYTIGTQVKPSMAGELNRFGVQSIDVHDQPPPWRPVVTRAMGLLEHDPDPLTRHLGSNLQKSTLKAVHRGAVSDPGGTSFVSAMALDPVGFGLQGQTQGWKPEDLQSGKAKL